MPKPQGMLANQIVSTHRPDKMYSPRVMLGKDFEEIEKLLEKTLHQMYIHRETFVLCILFSLR